MQSDTCSAEGRNGSAEEVSQKTALGMLGMLAECTKLSQRSERAKLEERRRHEFKESVVKEDHFTRRGQDSETKDRSQESW